MVKWILWYLRCALDVSLVCIKISDIIETIIGCVEDLDRRSLIRYAFISHGSDINGKANLQSTITLSMTGAEYMTTIEVVKETIWIKGLVGDLSLQ